MIGLWFAVGTKIHIVHCDLNGKQLKLKKKGKPGIARGHVLFWVPEWAKSQIMILCSRWKGSLLKMGERGEEGQKRNMKK